MMNFKDNETDASFALIAAGEYVELLGLVRSRLPAGMIAAEELGRIAGVNPQTVIQIRNGNQRAPKPATLARLLPYLNPPLVFALVTPLPSQTEAA